MNKRFYNFGGFRLDTHNQRLLRSGEAVTLTLKQFELLLTLVENAGDVVSKDQLFEQVWKDVAVADETLTRNISWLRQKLGDGGLIETVPKRGYRFAAEVSASDQPEIFVEETTLTHVRVEEMIELSETPALAGGFSLDKTNLSPTVEPPANAGASDKTWLAFAALALIAAVSIGFIIYQNYIERTSAKIGLAAVVRPFSGVQGREDSPAFSPDGKQLAFSWNGGDREKSDIYVQIVGAGEPIRLTNTEVHEQYPAFSPDGTHIAFVRDYKTYGEIVLIPALGGAERRIAKLFSGNYSISFAPDGKTIAAVDAIEEGGKQYAIFAFDLKTGERRRLTADGEFTGETTPRYAPDGKSLAFVRVFPEYEQDLFVVSTDGEMNEPVRLTTDRLTINSLAWSADGKEVFFVSPRESNRPNVWHIGAAGGTPKIFTTGGNFITNIVASPDGKTLAFVENNIHSDIYRVTLSEAATNPLIATSFVEDVPDFSPDGRHIVFRSNRSGSFEAWIGDANGRNLRQLTDEEKQVGIVRFSPDGRRIAFHASNGENKKIYVMSVEGGKSRRITEDSANNTSPTWSADGRYIFFASDRTGEDQIWRIPAAGGDAVQITHGGGANPVAAAADGKWIYYTKKTKESPKIELYRVSADATAANSDETAAVKINEAGFRGDWTLTRSGLYFVAPADKSPAKIKLYDFSTERISEVVEIGKLNAPGSAGMSVSPDGKTIVLAQFDQDASNIMLADIR